MFAILNFLQLGYSAILLFVVHQYIFRVKMSIVKLFYSETFPIDGRCFVYAMFA